MNIQGFFFFVFLFFFRIDWFDLLAVEGALKSLLQHHNLKASIFWCSAFFMVQFSHLHLTIGKNMALTLVSKVLSLLLNMLFRLATAFLPRSKPILISRLQSPSAVILDHKKIKFVTVSIVSQSVCHEVMELDAMIFIFWMLIHIFPVINNSQEIPLSLFSESFPTILCSEKLWTSKNYFALDIPK